MTERLPALLDGRTRVVAVTQASNTLGTRPDLRPVIDEAHRVGAVVVVDGCQGVVHGGVDVKALDCDFYAFSGHKLYAPTGIGVLYGKRDLLDWMPPFLSGGDMVDRVSFEKTTFAPVPLKFEAGTANFVGRSRWAKRCAMSGSSMRRRSRRMNGAAAACYRRAGANPRPADLRYDAGQVCDRIVQCRGGASL